MRVRAAVIAAAALALAGCSGTSEATAPDDVQASPTGTLTVFAAASLTDAFTELGASLEDRHPGLDVRFAFAGSATLAAQLLQGAPADVFASADEAQMARVTDADLAAAPAVFAQNVLMVAVPLDNPGDVRGLPDFAREELDLALCAPQVPCGAAAETLFAAAGVAAAPDTYEEDVRAVLTKVQLGEVDAGLVWFSDVVAAGDSILAFAPRESVIAETEYPIAALADAPNPVAAQAFVDLVLSREGQQALADAGFSDR